MHVGRSDGHASMGSQCWSAPVSQRRPMIMNAGSSSRSRQRLDRGRAAFLLGGHHRHRLLRLTGLDAQENQARRMLNDIARFRESIERKQKRSLPESVVASRWRDEVFEPTVAAVPEELWAALPAAEVFHQVLEHRWFLSEKAGKDVGIDEAVQSYVESELPTRPPERIVLEAPAED